MNKSAIRLRIAVLSIFLLCGCGISYGSPPRMTPPFEIRVVPKGRIVKPGQTEMSLEYWVSPSWSHRGGDTGSYMVVFLDPRNDKDTISLATYPVRYDSSFSYRGTFNIALPEADTNCLVVRVSCGEIAWRNWSYFIASGNEVTFYDLYEMPWPTEPHSAAIDTQRINIDINRDTLSQEQLQQRLDMVINIKRNEEFQTAEKVLGDIPDSCSVVGGHGKYIINMTLEQAYRLYELGLNLEAARGKEYKKCGSGSLDKEREDDSADDQSQIPTKYPMDSPFGISLDTVIPLTPSGHLPTENPITFYFRVKNTEYPRMAITNCFRIYSTDGAAWGMPVGDTIDFGW